MASTSSAPERSRHARAILGDSLCSRLANVKVLLVGAGGIGCELCTSQNTHVLRQQFVLNKQVHVDPLLRYTASKLSQLQ